MYKEGTFLLGPVAISTHVRICGERIYMRHFRGRIGGDVIIMMAKFTLKVHIKVYISVLISMS